MSVPLYFPKDELSGPEINFDMAADYLELTAFFASDEMALISDLINASEIGAETDYEDVDDEMESREEIVAGAIARIEKRQRALDESYPFALDLDGNVLAYRSENLTVGCGAYLICLVLSHLPAVSPVLHGSSVDPKNAEVRRLREYFQYLATAALAAEIQGQAWSFGYPRVDGTKFADKLEQVWRDICDGCLLRAGARGAPASPKDDQIDVFAARLHRDGLPGFLLAAGQAATGKNWREKSIKSHVKGVFYQRWFGEQPVTEMICYHLIPFARSDDSFVDDVRVLGNVLHRTRLPFRVQEAESLIERGLPIEAFDRLPGALDWLLEYRRRGMEAA